MGAAAAKCADRLVITSDNPRSEDPQAIIREIVAGIPADREFLSEPDREKAIQQAVGSATSGDTILIAGKGHETCQEIKGKFYAFADREVVKKLI
jgi:UDP-N-acetylmuramoyl-L-alanyl-D-glutamate--2,6-diaminopimelate ligase